MITKDELGIVNQIQSLRENSNCKGLIEDLNKELLKYLDYRPIDLEVKYSLFNPPYWLGLYQIDYDDIEKMVEKSDQLKEFIKTLSQEDQKVVYNEYGEVIQSPWIATKELYWKNRSAISA